MRSIIMEHDKNILTNLGFVQTHNYLGYIVYVNEKYNLKYEQGGSNGDRYVNLYENSETIHHFVTTVWATDTALKYDASIKQCFKTIKKIIRKNKIENILK